MHWLTGQKNFLINGVSSFYLLPNSFAVCIYMMLCLFLSGIWCSPGRTSPQRDYIFVCLVWVFNYIKNLLTSVQDFASITRIVLSNRLIYFCNFLFRLFISTFFFKKIFFVNWPPSIEKKRYAYRIWYFPATAIPAA